MTNKKNYNFLILACFLVWFIMMGSKNIYTAEYIEIGNIFSVDKPQASLAMTFYFITYSALQILLFFIMGKLNVKWYMLVTVFLSGVVTVFIALATNLWQLWWILAINGLLQGGIWGMCTSVLDKYLPTQMKATANMVMNIGTAVAGIISYGSASLFISFKRFDSPFTFFGIILSVSAVLFFIAVSNCAKIKKNNINEQNNVQTTTIKSSQNLPFTLKSSKKKLLFVALTFILSLFIHFVFYGALNWIPSMLTENFNIDESVAILISVIAPIATAIGPVFSIRHCEKFPNFVVVGFVYLSLACIFGFLMIFLFNVNVILSLIIVCLYLIIIQGAITIVFSVISYKLSEYVNAGAHSGLMNAAGGISAGIAPPIVGAIIECNNGWQLSYVTLFTITLIITLSILILLVLLRKNANKKKI